MAEVAEYDRLLDVTSNYVIMRNILSQLDWHELKNAQQVCPFWRQIIRHLTKGEIEIFYSHGLRNVVYFDWNYSNVEDAFYFVFGSRYSSSTNRHFKKPQPVCSVPKHVSIFIHLHWRLRQDNATYISNYSPCQLIFIPPNGTATDDIRYGGFSFPKIKGITITVLNVKYSDCFNTQNSKEFKKLENIMQTDLVKCILFFSESAKSEHETHHRCIKIIMDVINAQQGTNTYAIAGADSELTTINFTETHNIRIIVISKLKTQEDMIDCYSMLTSFKTPEIMRAQLNKITREISQTIQRRQHSFILRLSLSYSKSQMKEYNDTSALKKYFPTTPIFIVPGFERVMGKKADDFQFSSKGTSAVNIILFWGRLV